MKCPHCQKNISPYVTECRYCKRHIDKNNEWAVIQIETTGLNTKQNVLDMKRHEILRIIMLDKEGNIFFSQYYRPVRWTSWEEASKINGITPEMVKDSPVLDANEALKINSIIANKKIDYFVASSANFVSAFLRQYKINLPHAGIYGIADLFSTYQQENNISFNRTLKNIAKYFQYDSFGPLATTKSLEKPYMIWYCYMHLNKPQKEEVICEMCGTGEAGGLQYELFFHDIQILDYLKSIGVCNAAEKTMPSIFYNGRFTAKDTFDAFLLGLQIDRQETVASVCKVILNVKGKIIAISEDLFIAMQTEGKQILNDPDMSDDEPLFLDF